jgi:hypothetical protein
MRPAELGFGGMRPLGCSRRPNGAYEEEKYPFLIDEIAMIGDRHDRETIKFRAPHAWNLLRGSCTRSGDLSGASIHLWQIRHCLSVPSRGIGENFERWLIGHAVEIGGVKGLSVLRLHSDTARFAPETTPLRQQCLREWLAGLPNEA